MSKIGYISGYITSKEIEDYVKNANLNSQDISISLIGVNFKRKDGILFLDFATIIDEDYENKSIRKEE